MAGATTNGRHPEALPELDRDAPLVRVATAGSVDDGKSTLIGRLLYDSKQVLQDQLEHVEATSERRGDGYVNLALLTDGLRAEREQGITIDVAYRHFATPRRRFILADTPGHQQYTRNMVTGASTADVAIVLVDARKGVVEQTRRHSAIAALLGLPHLAVCVNKMDLVGFEPEPFEAIEAEVRDVAVRLGVPDVAVIPISALHGDNVVERSEAMEWYAGPSLLEHLETVPVAGDRNLSEVRFPVQWVIRPMSDAHHDYRGYAGQVAGGVLRPGDEVVVQPSGRRTRIKRIETWDGPLAEAFPPQSVTVLLEDDLDVGRGDVLCGAGEPPLVTRELEATVCWMSERPLVPGGRYAIKHTTRTARAIVTGMRHRLDMGTLETDEQPGELALNDIGAISLRTSEPLVADPYSRNRATGSFILIDEATNDTVGAGMISG